MSDQPEDKHGLRIYQPPEGEVPSSEEVHKRCEFVRKAIEPYTTKIVADTNSALERQVKHAVPPEAGSKFIDFVIERLCRHSSSIQWTGITRLAPERLASKIQFSQTFTIGSSSAGYTEKWLHDNGLASTDPRHRPPASDNDRPRRSR